MSRRRGDVQLFCRDADDPGSWHPVVRRTALVPDRPLICGFCLQQSSLRRRYPDDTSRHHHLFYFWTAVRKGGISKAAERLVTFAFVGEPALQPTTSTVTGDTGR